MSMKKQNQSSFAYISNNFDYSEQPNIQQNDQPNQTISKTSSYVSKDKMFCEMMNEMDGSMTSYLNKLVSKNEKDEEKKKYIQKIHERTKSNADIIATQPSNTKVAVEKGFNQLITHQSSPSQISNIFSSVNSTPTNQKSEKIEIEDDKKCDEFLGMLDSYLFDLSEKKVRKEIRKEIEECKPERKTVQKSRENNLYNLEFIHKIEAAVENEAQLRKENAYLMDEAKKLSFEMNKIKKEYNETGMNLIKNAKYLSKELEKEKESRRKLEEFLNHLNEKFTMLRPERKTIGAMSSRFHDYNNSQTTEQDEEDFYSTQQFDFRNKNQQKRKNNKSTSKLNRNKNLNMNVQNFSQMFGEIDFGEEYFDEEKDSVCYDM